MRNYIAVLFSVFVLMSAPSAGRAQRKTPTASPRMVIEALYKAHKQGNGHVFDRVGAIRLDRYFDTKLAGLLRKDILSTPPGEEGSLDFDPLFNTQDLQLSAFHVGQPKVSGAAATVLVSFRNYGHPVKIAYMMRRTPHGWRIANLDYGHGENLVKILRETQ
jgi:hypothetical protein